MFLKIHKQFFNLDKIIEVRFFHDDHGVWFVGVNDGKTMPKNYMIANQTDRDCEIEMTNVEERESKKLRTSWEHAEESFLYDLAHNRVADLTRYTVKPDETPAERKRVAAAVRKYGVRAGIPNKTQLVSVPPCPSINSY